MAEYIYYGSVTIRNGKIVRVNMLESLFGNRVVEKILFFLETYGQGYPNGMAGFYDIPVNGIQQQLRRLENGGIVVSKLMGRTRIYQFNLRYPFLEELKKLLQKALNFFPRDEINKYYRQRVRPQRKGKPFLK